jgi:hypothetical protein
MRASGTRAVSFQATAAGLSGWLIMMRRAARRLARESLSWGMTCLE